MESPHFTLDRMNPSLTAAGHELRVVALDLLCETDVTRKVTLTRELHVRWLARQIEVDPASALQPASVLPGRPARPPLVPPREVGRRAMTTIDGRAALIHALAHIEFNAINLALDAVWRFTDMPREFYGDWLQVAAEEALHFSLLDQHLHTLGFAYGDFNAHNSLWEMAEKTAGDITARMALVPRTLEARGLDATPAVRAKLAQVGDHDAAAILDIILRDEVGHVAIGNRWYRWLCERSGKDPVALYAELSLRHKAPQPRGPFNLDARRAAGFSDEEIAVLEAAGLDLR
jgi:uncharacterized ferritin-like protein (DUF455 family)